MDVAAVSDLEVLGVQPEVGVLALQRAVRKASTCPSSSRQMRETWSF
jgi:hypothetical protein